MKQKLFAVTKDVEGLVFVGEYKLFDVVKYEGGYDEVFDKYFAAYPLKFPKRAEHLAGYTSWYNYFQKIDEKIILRDLEGLSAVAGDKANIFQIDDGYEPMVGDWLLDNKVKFPKGMKYIADAVHSKGYLAGLWVAPFSAQFKAKIVTEHPDWFLTDEKGKKIIGGFAWNGFYVLDTEKPEVRDYVKKSSAECSTNGGSIWLSWISCIRRAFFRATERQEDSLCTKQWNSCVSALATNFCSAAACP